MNFLQRMARAMRELGLGLRTAGSPLVSAAQGNQLGRTDFQFLRTEVDTLGDAVDGGERRFRARLNDQSDTGQGHQTGSPQDACDDDACVSDPLLDSENVASTFARRSGTSYALVYVSRSVAVTSPHVQLRELRQSCQVRNDNFGVASALVLQDGVFCQWLEGSREVVEAMYQRIKRDTRHEAVMCIYRGEVRASALDSWCMGTRSLAMTPSEAFDRACAIRRELDIRPFDSPYAAWMGFAGLLACALQPSADAESVERLRGSDRSTTRSICAISHRSALSGQLLVDANQYAGVRILLSRWGGEGDTDSDLQSAEAAVQIDDTPVRLLCTSFRSLRVGIIREKILRAHELIVVLPRDDLALLELHVQQLRQLTALTNGVRLVSVIAPTWDESTREHASHLLKINQFAGQVFELDAYERGSWRAFANLL